MVSLAEEDHLRRLFRVPSCHSYLQLMAELSTFGVLLSNPLSILFSVILSALCSVHHSNTFLEN